MPELTFKGKEFVFNHHLSVPFRTLVADPSKSIGHGRLDDNLIIQGDNLHALKALLPQYAGKVDCIFIDPPYNTGNEGWSYSDNVNAPMIKEWLNTNPINVEDGLRHDKWLVMMWPRLRLLHDLLSEQGSIWITLDDNEVHHARMALDEIFGEENFVGTIIWHKMDSPKNTAQHFSEDHDYVIVYAKRASNWSPNLLKRSEEMVARYKNPDNDPRGPWLLGDLAARNAYAQGRYPITTKSGRVIDGPPAGSYWRISRQKFDELDKDNRIWWGELGENRPGIKRFLSEVRQGVVPQTLWSWKEVGSTRNAKQHLSALLSASGDDDLFVTPKPVSLVRRIVQLATNEQSVVLDSFAGSATTAHAVLAQNDQDGGKRKFILVEMEDYADSLTAERVRRVINGYAFTGIQREELLREKLTWAKLQNMEPLLKVVQSFDNTDAHRFDRLNKTIKDGELIVTGERQVEERTEGLSGSFTYCTLGDPLELDKLLSGETLPEFSSLGAVLFHMATNESIILSTVGSVHLTDLQDCYLGQASGVHVWLFYQPDIDFLSSPQSALTLQRAQEIVDVLPDARHVVFAPSRFVSQRILAEKRLPVEFAPLPFALYRVELGQTT